MIYGIGIDIIEIERIEKSVERFGDKFLNRIFTRKELEYCLSKASKYQHLAARFAAKEAIAKALSFNGDRGFSWQDIEITNKPNGRPVPQLFNRMKQIVGDDKLLKITMSHSDHYVTCFAILSTKSENILP